MERKSLVERLLVILKGGDEAKLARFESKVGKFIATSIKKSEDAIESLKDRITDAEESLNDTILGVTAENLQSTSSVENYVVKYLDDVNSKMEVIEELQDEIKDEEASIARYKKIEARLYA